MQVLVYALHQIIEEQQDLIMKEIKNDSSLKEGMLNMDDINGMLDDTDLRVLQQNYRYILWSILAVGILTTTVHVLKK